MHRCGIMSALRERRVPGHDQSTEAMRELERENRRGGARAGYTAAKMPPLVRGLQLLSLCLQFLVCIPVVLVRGTFRGQRVHPLTYLSAAALCLAMGALVLQHAGLHQHTYCEARYLRRSFGSPLTPSFSP